MATIAEIINVMDNVLNSTEDSLANLHGVKTSMDAARGGLVLVAEGALPLETALSAANDVGEKIGEVEAGITGVMEMVKAYRALLTGAGS